jgi:arylsulfatase
MAHHAHRRLRRVLGLAAVLSALLGPTAAAEPPRRVLVITLDTLRADRLGIYGYDRPTSPALDAFAGAATVFLDATCSMPTTLPSHWTLFTGLTPAQHGVTHNGMLPPRDAPSLFELLEVPSAAIVAADVLASRFLVGLGIGEVLLADRSPESHQAPADAVTARARSWLAGRGEEGFVLWLHYFDTHEPYDPVPRLAERFTGAYDGPLGNALSVEWLAGLNREEDGPRLSSRDRRHVSDLYDAEVAFLDEQLGELFAFLEERGLWDETTIVIVGDHGQALGERGFWGHGERLLEPVIRVPFLVKLPRQARARKVAAAVETLDLVPTLLELHGVPIPAGLLGRSLMAGLRGERLPPVRYRIVERRTYPSAPDRRGVAVVADRSKLVLYLETDGEHPHLGRISGEGGLDGENFYRADAEEMALFRVAIAARELVPGPAGDALSPADEATREMLRSLGYLQ